MVCSFLTRSGIHGPGFKAGPNWYQEPQISLVLAVCVRGYLIQIRDPRTLLVIKEMGVGRLKSVVVIN